MEWLVFKGAHRHLIGRTEGDIFIAPNVPCLLTLKRDRIFFEVGKLMRLFLRSLAFAYLLGFSFHIMDLFDFRLQFSQMNTIWQAWILFLIAGDFIAAGGLWFDKAWGIIAFHVVAIAQLVAYIGFRDVFGDQTFLIVFHVVTLLAYHFLRGLRLVKQARSPRST